MADPDLNLLLALDALLAEASVAAAARRLGLSASAMSRTLARLRLVTGDALLVRAGRHMVPTPHAEALRERSRETLEAARALLMPAETGLQLSTLERTFVVRSNDGFLQAFAASLLDAVAGCAPRVVLHFVGKSGKSAAALREARADLEIGVADTMGPEVRLQALFRDRFVGVVRAGHPLASGQVKLIDYTRFGHVVATRHAQGRGPVDDALAAAGCQRRIVAMVPGFVDAIAVARASDLVALVPASLLRASTGDTCGFELPVSTPAITVSQMWHPRVDADPAHRWLRQCVRAVCRGEAVP